MGRNDVVHNMVSFLDVKTPTAVDVCHSAVSLHNPSFSSSRLWRPRSLAGLCSSSSISHHFRVKATSNQFSKLLKVSNR